MSFLTKVLAASAASLLAAGALAHQADAPVRIGILSTFGQKAGSERFAPSLTTLEKALGKQLEIHYYDIPGLAQALRARQLDFFISNPGFFASKMSSQSVRQLASLKIPEAADPAESMGGVFVVRSDSAVRSVADLRGRSAASVSREAFGGYFIPLGELQKRGFDPDSFFGSVSFVGYPMQNVLAAVKSGQAEVGLVRSCLLEHMARSGEDVSGLRVVEPVAGSGLTCRHSTSLYPDWVFASTPAAGSEDARRAVIALLSMPEGTWGISGGFDKVNTLYKGLRVGHYAYLRTWSLRGIAERFGFWILGGTFLVFLLAFQYMVVRREVRRKTQKLRQAMAEREAAQRKAMEATSRLNQLERISLVGMLSNLVAHELKQPLGAIGNYADGIVSLCSQPQPDSAMTVAAAEQILRQTERAGRIIDRVRGYARSGETVRIPVGLQAVTSSALADLRHTGKALPAIEVDVREDARVMADPVELSLVILNLVRNAADALAGDPAGRIEISLSQKQGSWILAVSDNGPLTSAEGFENLFEPRVSSKDKGLGLGLSISARLVEQLGGRLALEANAPHGIRAILRLPMLGEWEDR